LYFVPPTIDASSDSFRARAATVPPPAVRTGHPTIVVWLQESSMDLRLFAVPGAELPALPMYDADARTRAFGALRVHSWGGSTWLSEFALLTGLSHFDFGPTGEGVYYTIVGHVRPSLPRLLKAQGYRSIAISGVPKGLYNMETAQRQLGFDEVLNPLDFPEWGGKSLADHLISDEELGRYADQIIARSSDRPLFLFVLSMMQHGPYDSAHPVGYGLDRAGLPPRLAARVSDYAERMAATDRAARDFGARLLGRTEPTVFAYFGDHHPNLEGSLTYAAGVAHPQFQTAYAVKSNLPGAPAPVNAARMIDVSFLGALVLEQAGLPLDPHFTANRAMRHLCDGQLTDCPDTALADSYRAYVYGDLHAASQD
jgi:phosphoglycerol transferase MdoB-like AlkP superfamily enzyme